LRGPAEAAHFLRAYGIACGELLPSTVDHRGRRGLLLPAHLHRDFAAFEKVRYHMNDAGFSYRTILAEHIERRTERLNDIVGPQIFVLCSGSEATRHRSTFRTSWPRRSGGFLAPAFFCSFT
jgi:hypothetical protein